MLANNINIDETHHCNKEVHENKIDNLAHMKSLIKKSEKKLNKAIDQKFDLLQNSIKILTLNVEKSINKVSEENRNKSPNKSCLSVHKHFCCDGCGMDPIIGRRFRCQECSNLDLCESCEIKGMHTHEMTRYFMTDKQPEYLSDTQYSQ